MPTEKERKDIQKATIYDLRRLISNGDKETFTKEELCRWLDTIADAKEQKKQRGDFIREVPPIYFKTALRISRRCRPPRRPRRQRGRRIQN